MGQADRPSELSMDDGTRQAMLSLAAMLAFVFVGLGLAAYGAHQLGGQGSGMAPPPSTGGGDQPVPSNGGETGGTTSTGGGTGKPAPSGDEARRIASLIRQLDHQEWSVRSKASRDLMALGERARPALQATLRNPPSDHVRISIERLIETLDARKK